MRAIALCSVRTLVAELSHSFLWILALGWFLIAITAGCEKEPNITSLPPETKIQINVPDGPHSGTKTRLITYDVESNRDIFYEFYSSAKRVGKCSPQNLEQEYKAYEVIRISFWGPSMKPRKAFYILKKPSGEWISEGYGGVEIFDVPEGFPHYRYSESILKNSN